MAAAAATGSEGRRLVGFDNFVRHNPKSDKFDILKFHSIEFYCNDASNVSSRFMWGLGMNLVCKSDLTTGNFHYASQVIRSKELVFAFTSPYSNSDSQRGGSATPHPNYDQEGAHQFVTKHGLAVRAVSILVKDAAEAYDACIATDSTAGVLKPTELVDKGTQKKTVISEVKMFDDTVIRWISGDYEGPFLPNYELCQTPDLNFGIERLDHCVSNVPKLFDAVDHLMNMTGFHEFSEFTAADVGTVDSGLNSMVLASNNEFVLLPVNEPTFGTKKKSQIQTYLEHNNGAGVQHLALKTDDIFHTMREMRQRTYCGGFDFMPKPAHSYYEKIPSRVGVEVLSKEQLLELEELGVLADRDDQGVLLQVFTKPLGDRPTIFVEIIQRIGCDKDAATGAKMEQAAGCGGFGKGNFSELFKSIEEFEKQMEKK